MHSRHHNDGHHHNDHTHSAFSSSGTHHSQTPFSHVTSSQEKSITSSGNEEKKQLRVQQVFIVMILICVAITFVASFQLQHSSSATAAQRDSPTSSSSNPEISLSIQLKQYNRLVSRAQELVKQYKTLSGQTNLPSELSFQFTSNHKNNVEDISSKDIENNNNNNFETKNDNAANKKQKKSKRKQQNTIEASSSTASSSSSHEFSHNKRKFASNPRDLVLGMAYDVDARNIAIFVKSLRNVSSANCILFVKAPVDSRIKDLGQENKIKLITFGKDKVPDHLALYHPSTLRWHLFRSFFIDHEGYKMIYNRVFLLDVRDTYFQHDPFVFFNPDLPSFHVFQGVTNRNLGQCEWNKGWIEDCFGQNMLTSIAKEIILCSGTIAGSMDRIADYIDVMGGIIANEPGYNNIPAYSDITTEINNRKISTLMLNGKFPHCERNGVDQGVHNVLVHKHAVVTDPVVVWPQEDSPVANLQAQVATVKFTKTNNNNINENNYKQETIQVVNPDGQEVLVVHQYDRHLQLQRSLMRRYVDWMNTDDFVSQWQNDAVCKEKYDFIDGYDAFAGHCDVDASAAKDSETGETLNLGGMNTATQCCSLCEKVKACHAFAFAQGHCYLKTCREVSSVAENEKMMQDIAKFRKILENDNNDKRNNNHSNNGDLEEKDIIVGDIVTGRRCVAKQ